MAKLSQIPTTNVQTADNSSTSIAPLKKNKKKTALNPSFPFYHVEKTS